MAAETRAELLERIRQLQERLDEAEDTLRALRSGEVDAVAAAGPDGDRVYTLRGADEAYRLMVEEMAEGALTLSFDGLILYSNDQFAAMLGVPLERVIGAQIRDFMAPEDAVVVSALLAGRAPSKAVARFKTGAAEWVPVYLSANTLELDASECICLVVTDLTERKRSEEVVAAERLAHRQAAELQAIMDAVPAAVLIARDREGREIIGNRTSHELLRVAPGRNLSISAPKDERPGNFRVLKDGKEIPPDELPLQYAARTGRVVSNYELDLVFADGSYQRWLGNAVPLFDDAGQPRGSVGAFMDITDRKRSEERLRQVQKLESIGLLAGGIAHDFNNLLVGVIGSASLVREMLPPAHEASDLLESIVKTGEQAAHLTRQMLAYSGKGRFVIEPVNLSSLIEEFGGLVQPSLSKKAALHLSLEPDLPPVEADRSQLQQIFTNLALNASEAIGDSHGLITVTTGVREVDEGFILHDLKGADVEPGTYVYMEVRDTGCGMNEATQAHIFDPFFTTKFMGRGLGLAAVSGIVRGHKGAVKVISAPGEGSSFSVLFPAARSVAAATAPVRRQASRATGTVLVVDDEETVRELARRALQRRGFKVVVAETGSAAIDVLKRESGQITVVLLDLSMPGMGGAEVLPKLRKIRPDLKVVVSSGYDEAEALRLFAGLPVAGFVQKPYTVSRLVETIERAME